MLAARRSVTCAHLLLLLLLASLTSLTGCSTSSTATPPAAAAPAIASVTPASVTAGAAGFTLAVTGSGFVSGSAVQWNGSPRSTTYGSATQVSAAIPASDVAAAGTAQVVVANPDGQKSAAASFTVNAALPVLSSLSPATAAAGSAAFTLTVNGTGFTSGATVAWAGSARTTTFISSIQLSAAIPASDLATAGSVSVDVAQAGVRSTNQLPFAVTAAIPTLTSLSPATVVAGSAGFTLTVNGTGFTNAASVAFNGSARTTTFVSATQLTAAIPAADVTTAGNFAVDVAQSGVRSTNQLPFTVTAAIPTLTSLSPATVVSGSAAFTLMVNGTRFTNAATVTFNGSAKPTAFVSATQLTAAIAAADVATAGNPAVDVVQGGVHASNTLPFAITVPAPAITSLSPTGVVAGSADTTLSVSGTGFFADSVVKFGGTALTTSYKNGTLLQATVPAASLASPATVSVTVQNPAGEGGVSNAASFTISAVVSGKIVQLLTPSYLTGGVSNRANNNSPPTLSQDGRYAAFASYSSDLVSGDTNGNTDAFLRDTCVGSASAGCVRSTTRLSPDPDTMFLNGASRLVVLSSDARYAAFDALDSRRTDLRDNCIGASGCTPAISHVDYLPGSTDPAPPSACCSVLSPDGRYALFAADVNNSNNTLSRGIFVRDTCVGATGCTPATTRVALGPGATPPRQPFQADISSGGRYVLFRTAGNDIIASYSSALHLFLQDTCLGAPAGCTVSYTPIDVKADGTEGEGNLANDNAAAEQPSLSKDGRYVLFSSTEPQIIAAGTPGGHLSEVYLRDTCIGAPAGCVPSSTLVSADPAALSKNYRSFIGYRGVSEHGRYVAFLQEGLDSSNVFIDSVRVRDTCLGAPAGCVPSISNASLDPDNVLAVPHSTFQYPSISADGHYVAFMSGSGQVYLALTGY